MMKQMRVAAVVGLAGMVVAGCGRSPFGPGAVGGLNLFARIAKAMQKPAAIEKEESGKEGSKALVSEATTAAKRLAKGAKGAADPSWLAESGIQTSGDTLTYYEVVANKPNEEDPEKLSTGRAEVKFKYSGGPVSVLTGLDATLITDIYSWSFEGEERKTWKSEICSVKATVLFSTTSIADFKPGRTWFWAKNISSALSLGKDDTASFELDSLNDVDHIQYGEGHFYDAHTGEDHADAPNSFDFDLQILHKNVLDATKPYARYDDNEGIMSFYLQWGTDSLYYTIHFFPVSTDEDLKRTGTLRKNGPDGPVRVEFTAYDKDANRNVVVYYDDEGNEIGSE